MEVRHRMQKFQHELSGASVSGKVIDIKMFNFNTFQFWQAMRIGKLSR